MYCIMRNSIQRCLDHLVVVPSQKELLPHRGSPALPSTHPCSESVQPVQLSPNNTGTFGLCARMCDFKWSARANLLSQCAHGWRFSATGLWIVSCFLTAALVGKLLLQKEHRNGRDPSVCFHCLCATRALVALKASPQWSHL